MEWADNYMYNAVHIGFVRKDRSQNSNSNSKMKNVSDYHFEELMDLILNESNGRRRSNGGKEEEEEDDDDDEEKERIEIRRAYLWYGNSGKIEDGFICFFPSPSGKLV
ncbi:MAG: hypothetical protein LBI26_03245 [Holosporales bacterium]|nr:hypothetical protein [Holosporales bacterium]